MRARRVLIEGAWTYRFLARVSHTLQARLEDLPIRVREIAWKAQVRLANHGAGRLEGLDDLLTAVAEPWIEHRREA
jgi:hypothetical protein